MTVAVDTSVVVAALSPWHEHHEAAVTAVDAEAPVLVGHVVAEALSVLTRLPDRAVAPAAAWEAIRRTFPDPPLVLTGRQLVAAHDRAVAAGIAGGRTYDAVIATTAAHHGAVLLTGDRRARGTYDVLGCPHRAVW